MAESVADKYKVPAGLRPLLEAFARETLRVQPADIYDFGRLFFNVLQVHRQQNSGSDVIEDQISYEMFRGDLQRKYQNRIGAVVGGGAADGTGSGSRPSSPQDVAATKIQAAFRGHFVRNHPERYGIDCYDLTRRNSTNRLNSVDNKRGMKRHSVGGYSHVFDSLEDRAATKIQTEIRGYLTRKKFNRKKMESSEAATKIQAHIRGFLTRKHLEEKGLLSPSRSHHSLHSNKSDEA